MYSNLRRAALFLCLFRFLDILFLSLCLWLLFHLLFTHLLSEIVVELLMLDPLLVLPVDVLQVRLLVLFDALLDVELFLLSHHLFIVVPDDLTHAIHDSLDALTTIRHLLFACLLFLKCQPHV